jgi:hypothetical protein
MDNLSRFIWFQVSLYDGDAQAQANASDMEGAIGHYRIVIDQRGALAGLWWVPYGTSAPIPLALTDLDHYPVWRNAIDRVLREVVGGGEPLTFQVGNDPATSPHDSRTGIITVEGWQDEPPFRRQDAPGWTGPIGGPEVGTPQAQALAAGQARLRARLEADDVARQLRHFNATAEPGQAP